MEPQHPSDDSEFAAVRRAPRAGQLLPVLYPGVFPNLAGLNGKRAPTSSRSCSPASRGHRPRVPELHRTDARRHAATQHRDPAVDGESEPRHPRRRPRRVPQRAARRSTTSSAIELRAIAGATNPLVDSGVHAGRAAAGLLTQGLEPAPNRYQPAFPYLGLPHDGFSTGS